MIPLQVGMESFQSQPIKMLAVTDYPINSSDTWLTCKVCREIIIDEG